MGLWELIVIALGLSMDAFAICIGKGLSTPNATVRQAGLVGAYFGGFQALMPLVGYALGAGFGSLITSADHWIAFVLLALIGAKMVHESRDDERALDSSLAIRTMLPLAVATSIDALAVGVSFAFLGVEIASAAAIIGAITFAVSVLGLRLGNVLGARNRARAELFGGLVLIGMGLKILVEHLGILG